MNNPPQDHSFINMGQQINFPFTVVVKSEDGTFKVTAEKALRIAPNKRIVCSGRCDNKRIVMKLFLKNRKINRYFNKELNGLKALITSGIKTPEIIFHGELENTDIRVIVLKEIFPASDTMTVWNNITEHSAYFDFQKLIIHEIAILHKAGLKQDDLHLGNFLISKNRIYTIDGDGIDIKRGGQPLSKKYSLKNLCVFLGQFYPQFDYLAKKSVDYYAKCRNWPPDPKLFSVIESKIQKVQAIRLKKYLKKIFRECSEFVHQKNWNIEFVCDRKIFDSGFEKFIKNPNFFIKNGSILKKKVGSTLVRINIDKNLFVVKCYNYRKKRYLLNKHFKKTRVRNFWHNAHLLKQLGVKLPRPILFMEELFGPFCLKAYFIVEYYPEIDVNNFPHDIISSNVKVLHQKKHYSTLLRQVKDH